jgi:hypothetical protein
MKLALGMLLLVACNPFKSGSIEGQLESKGAAGNWVLSSGSCNSGQREAYFGAIAFGAEGTGVAVKLVKDPTKGWSVIVNKADTCKAGPEKADCRAIVLTADNCTKFDVDVTNTNTTINDIKVVDGKLELDCSDGPDNTIKGKLTLNYCH